jgi:hypothetical protein
MVFLVWQVVAVFLSGFSKSVNLKRHMMVVLKISDCLIKDVREEEERKEHFGVCRYQFTDL